MNFIPTPTQAKAVMSAVNTREFQKWVLGGKRDLFTIECEISEGGKNYCMGMIEMLNDVQCYGYKKAIQALNTILECSESGVKA